MKIVYSLLLCLCSVAYIQAQDIIYPKKKSPIKAKVEEVRADIIIYKRSDNPGGPRYELRKAYIDSIIYENGTIDKFKIRVGAPHPGPRERIYREPGTPRRDRLVDPKYLNRYTQQLSIGAILLNPEITILTGWEQNFDVPDATVAATIKYDKSFFKNWMGISVAPFVAINTQTYGAAFSLRAHLKRTGRVRLSVGPEYNFTRLNMVTVYDIYPIYESIARKYTTNLSTLYGTLELYFHVTPQWYVDFNCGLGGNISNTNLTKHVPDNWQPRKSDVPGAKLGLGLGYRF